MLNRQHERLRTWWDSRPTEEAAWQQAAYTTDAVATLTASELEQMTREMQDVISKWCEHGRNAIAGSTPDQVMSGPEARRPIFVFAYAFPEQP